MARTSEPSTPSTTRSRPVDLPSSPDFPNDLQSYAAVSSPGISLAIAMAMKDAISPSNHYSKRKGAKAALNLYRMTL